jgi:hypothetical protein
MSTVALALDTARVLVKGEARRRRALLATQPTHAELEADAAALAKTLLTWHHDGAPVDAHATLALWLSNRHAAEPRDALLALLVEAKVLPDNYAEHVRLTLPGSVTPRAWVEAECLCCGHTWRPEAAQTWKALRLWLPKGARPSPVSTI